MKLKSLSSRMVIFITAVILLLTTAFTVFHALHIGILLNQRRIVNGLALADVVAHQVGQASLAEEAEHFKGDLDAVMADPRVVYVAVYDARGAIIGKASRIPIDLTLAGKGVKKLMLLKQPLATQQLNPVGEETYEFYAPIILQYTEGIVPAAGLVRLGISRADITSAQRDSVELAISIGLIMLGLGSLLAFSVSRRVTRPLAALKEGAKSISDGNLNVTLPVRSDDEIGDLARAFNVMAQALRETTVSKDYVDNIVGSMKEVLVVLTCDLKIETLNRSAEELLGFAPSELIGAPADTIFPEGVAIQLKDGSWRDFLDGRSVSNVETSLKTKDGNSITADLSVAPMLNSNGDVIGIVCVARDMREVNALLSQLKARTEELENYQAALIRMLEDNEKAKADAIAEQQKMIASLNAMAEGVVMFSPKGEVILLNVSARNMLGLKEGEAAFAARIVKSTGLDMDAFLNPGEGGSPVHLSGDVMADEATKHIIRIEGIPVVSGAERIGSMLILRDITRESHLDDAKHELVSNVSHELRTPLASIKNTVSNILAGVVGPLSEDMRKHMEVCQVNLQRLGATVDNLIDLANIDSGNLRIHRAQVDVVSLIRDACRSLGQEIAHKRIRFSADLPEVPLELYCDASAIERAFLHLAGNAIRFTPEDGEVRISVKEGQTHVEIAISDSGVGIPLEDQDSIFTGFHQVGRTYGPGGKGLGLGLPICRQLIEMHEGSIGVTSAPGKGSRFYFYLPRLGGEDLIAAHIEDEMGGHDGAQGEPYLWMFAPIIEGGAVDAELKAAACEIIESAVRRAVKGVGGIVTHDLHHEGVFAIARAHGEAEAKRLNRRLASATKHISFRIGDQSVGCKARMGRVGCGDPNVTPKQHIAAVRKLVLAND